MRDSKVRALWLAMLSLMVLLTGCSGSTPEVHEDWQAVLDDAAARSGEGDDEGAHFVLRRGIAEYPRQGELHFALARAELARGRPELGLLSLDKAEQLGIATPALTALRAKAHYQAADRTAITQLKDALAGDGGALEATVRYYHLRTLVEDSIRSSDALFEGAYALYEVLARDEVVHLVDLTAAQTSQALDALDEHPKIAQAREHVRCATEYPSAVNRWTPAPIDPERRVLRVGPGEAYTTIAAAASAARDGDVVEIAAGEYAGDVAVWSQNDLLIRGVGNTRPHIRAAGRRVQKRDVWLFRGDGVVVENVEISGARSPAYHNGAAIRHIGTNITLRHVYLHHNENGLLTGNQRPDSRVLVEYSEFAFNGDGSGKTHNIYVGHSADYVMRYSYSHNVTVGHLVKSRAAKSVISYNRLSDEGGNSSFLVDVPNGGVVHLVGNVLEQGAEAENKYVVSYAGEGLRFEENELYLLNNTLYNRALRGIFVRLATPTPAHVMNNIAIGVPVGLVESDYRHTIQRAANVTSEKHGLRDPKQYDFTPTATSQVVDAGEQLETGATAEYVHPAAWRRRVAVDRPDIGAYEICRGAPETASPVR